MNTVKHHERSALLCVVSGLLLAGNLVLPQIGLAETTGANVLFILDGSGSMWGRLDNVEKIVIAKDTMNDLVQELPDSFKIGLMVYGHRSKGSCDDIELLSPVGAADQAAIVQQIQGISPKGKTPITKSIELAAQHLETIEEETTIVLVSDGEETCEGDPCVYVKQLKDKGITFTMHVVGFDVNTEQRAQLECIANAGGGRYFSAQNAMQLEEAFTAVKTEVIKQVETKPEPQAGDIWTEPITGMEFVWVPGGCFQMGQTQHDRQQLLEQIKAWAGGDVQKAEAQYKEAHTHELPEHRICLDGFWMSKYEVTNAQYRTWKANHDSNNPEAATLKEHDLYPLNGDTQPAVSVSWEEASAFTDWLTDQQQNQYIFRLPTEAEWEYAARAGTTTSRFWGDEPNQACRYANVYDQTLERVLKNNWYLIHRCEDGYVAAAPVGSFRPNAFGLYDMIGNVWEWCRDWYDANYYAVSPVQNPQGPSTGQSHVIRGGSWNFQYTDCRSASRIPAAPTDRADIAGFRVVRTP